jgi:hypothetical protein
MKWNHTIWEDGKKDEAINIIAEDGNKALDLAAEHFGYVDYADMAQGRGWDSEEGDGLNIVTDTDPVDSALYDRIKKELEVNDNLISEERLSYIAADFYEDNEAETSAEVEQIMNELECKIENMAIAMGGKIDR